MNKHIKTIIITTIICMLLFIPLGIVIKSTLLNKEEKCEIKKQTSTSQEKLADGFFETERKLEGNYYVSSGYDKNSEQYIYFYNHDDHKFVKGIKGSFYAKHILGINDSIYEISYEPGAGVEHTTTMILDSKLNVIIDANKLPESFKDYEEDYFEIDEDKFTPYYNDNDTIAIKIKDIYIYDFSGNLIKTIKNENDSIRAAYKNYYVLNENGKVQLVNYETEEKLVIANEKGLDMAYSPTSGNHALIYKNEESNLQITLIKTRDEVNSTCYTYVFNENNKTFKLTETDPNCPC